MVKFEQNQFEVKHQPSLDLKVPVLIKKKRVWSLGMTLCFLCIFFNIFQWTNPLFI